MLKHVTDPREAREALLTLLPTSGTLAGIAIGLAGIVRGRVAAEGTTVADDLLLVAALGFLLTCYLVFFALRSVRVSLSQRLMLTIDRVFLAALTLLVFAGFVIVYAFM